MKQEKDLSTAEINSAKITRFVGRILWLIFMLFVVICAVLEMEPAIWLLHVYVGMLALGFVSMFALAARPAHKLAKQDLTTLKTTLAPSAQVIRIIGSVFSVIEIGLLVGYGYLYIPILWGLTEIVQYTSLYNVRQAVELQELQELQDK